MDTPFDIEEDNPVLSFKNIGICTSRPTVNVLSNVSGYVVKGGMTAIMGGSGSGKTLLLEALSGRTPNLTITGDFFIEGMRSDPKDIVNPVAYVPFDSSLIGELTCRETLFNSAALRCNKPLADINEDVERFLDILGVGEVADRPIGTYFTRGLSDGQKKLINIGAELVASPLVLFLDEPTNDMDSEIAYEVLKIIKDIARESNMSIILSVSQPSARMMDLFDHIMLLGGGSMNFFGTTPEAIEYFSSIGFAPLDNHMPTDYFLQVSDPTYAPSNDFNFEGAFTSSAFFHKLNNFLDAVERRGSMDDSRGSEFFMPEGGATKHAPDSPASGIDTQPERFMDDTFSGTTFWRQYSVLVERDISTARRDPSLYLVQVLLSIALSLCIGAVFSGRKPLRINSTMSAVPSSLLWIVLLMAYLQISKVHHLSKGAALFKHERANNSYGIPAAFLAELTVAWGSTLLMLPGSAIAYFMMGYPGEAYSILFLIFWTTTLTSESLMSLLCRVHKDASVVVFICQAVLVLLTVFGGGVFIRQDVTPLYWQWLQAVSPIAQAASATIIQVSNYISYECATLNGVCTGPYGVVFPCDALPDDGERCFVRGRTVLYITQGVSNTDTPWAAYKYLILILVACRLGVLLLMIMPPDRLAAWVKKKLSADTNDVVMKGMSSIRRIEAQLMSLCADKHHNAVHPSGPSKKAAPRGRAPGNAKDGGSYDQLFDEAFDSHMDEDLVLTDPDRAPFCMVWRNLTFVTKGKCKSLLDGLTGFARSGRVLSIMGPVGAGSCTLLEALAHRSSHGSASGEILIGKRDLLPYDVAYVPEIEEINPNLTVFEQIELIGLLKCYNSRAMYLRLTTILRVTGMVKKSTVKCGQLSRVHLKRVGVAMGLISNPSVLALERPITTLDNVAAVILVQMLIDLAHALNVAVVMTVHRPSSMVFELLQDLYVLQTGKLAYSGPATCLRQYFRDLGYLCPPKTSLSDFALDILSRPPVYQTEPWQLIYFQSNFGRNMRIRINVCDQSSTGTHSPNYPPTWSNRLSHMTIFFLKYYVRDRSFYLFRVLCLALVSLFYGTLFIGLTPETGKLSYYRGAIVHTTWMVLLSVVLSSRLLVRDRKQSLELIKSATCGVNMYCAAQFIASIPFNMTAAITFQMPFYFLSKLNPSFFVLIYTALVSCGHMLFVEAILLCAIQRCKNAILSAKVAVFVLVLQYLFSGYFIAVLDMPQWVRWICYLTPTRYSFDGYLHIILDTQRFAVTASPSLKMTGGEVLVAIHADSRLEPYNNLLILCCWILLLRVVHYVLLLRQMWPNLPSRSKKPDRRTLPSEDVEVDDDDSIPSIDTEPRINCL